MKNEQRVALVQMPVVSPRHPSLGLSLLKGGLTRMGVESRIYYLNLRFAQAFDQEFYIKMNDGVPSIVDLVGDWIFSDVLWGSDAARDAEYVARVLRGNTSDDDFLTSRTQDDEDWHESMLQHILDAKSQAPAFVERCLEEVPWRDYEIVGFTSMFQQHAASLAMAKRIKERFPNIKIVFGGPNCEGPMSIPLVRNFGFVDAALSGEGDEVFPAMVERLLRGKPVEDLPGVVTRANAGNFQGTVPIAPAITNMDDLPYPDYGDFFEDLAQSTLAEDPEIKPYLRLPFETSRGCWWGQKTHCTFCGLNGSTVSFRYKSGDRAFEELRWLLEQYGKHSTTMMIVDNILPYEYMKSFLPRVRDEGLGAELFYEVKSNLREEQVRLLREAGISTIQPGIESLSTPVLRLMHKGVSALQNVQLLKWCRQYDVSPRWNFLIGFPGERAEHYEAVPDLIRTITHLQPPMFISSVKFVRFSPYMNHPAEFGLTNVRPHASYGFVYPGLSPEDLMNAAAYFEADCDWQAECSVPVNQVIEAINDWLVRFEDASMFSVPFPDRVLVVDQRRSDHVVVHDLQGGQALIHQASEGITNVRALERLVAEKLGAAKASWVAGWVDELVREGLLLREGENVLAMAIPLGYRYSPPVTALQRFQAYLKDQRTAAHDRSARVVGGEAAGRATT